MNRGRGSGVRRGQGAVGFTTAALGKDEPASGRMDASGGAATTNAGLGKAAVSVILFRSRVYVAESVGFSVLDARRPQGVFVGAPADPAHLSG